MAWATIGEDDRQGLNVALNEATWIGMSVDTAARGARLLLSALSLPADGPVPPDIPLPEFISSGVRWWDGLHSGDSRTSGKGIFPRRGE